MMDAIVDKYASRIAMKFESSLAETNNKIDTMQNELKESMGELNARITIIENDHKKTSTDMAEKIYVIENNTIANANKINILENALQDEIKKNKSMRPTMTTLNRQAEI